MVLSSGENARCLYSVGTSNTQSRLVFITRPEHPRCRHAMNDELRTILHDYLRTSVSRGQFGTLHTPFGTLALGRLVINGETKFDIDEVRYELPHDPDLVALVNVDLQTGTFSIQAAEYIPNDVWISVDLTGQVYLQQRGEYVKNKTV